MRDVHRRSVDVLAVGVTAADKDSDHGGGGDEDEESDRRGEDGYFDVSSAEQPLRNLRGERRRFRCRAVITQSRVLGYWLFVCGYCGLRGCCVVGRGRGDFC